MFSPGPVCQIHCPWQQSGRHFILKQLGYGCRPDSHVFIFTRLHLLFLTAIGRRAEAGARPGRRGASSRHAQSASVLCGRHSSTCRRVLEYFAESTIPHSAGCLPDCRPTVPLFPLLCGKNKAQGGTSALRIIFTCVGCRPWLTALPVCVWHRRPSRCRCPWACRRGPSGRCARHSSRGLRRCTLPGGQAR